MKIERFVPDAPPPPPLFTMTFDQDEGWALVGALFLWVGTHKDAVKREAWRVWAEKLESELRRS